MFGGVSLEKGLANLNNTFFVLFVIVKTKFVCQITLYNLENTFIRIDIWPHLGR